MYKRCKFGEFCKFLHKEPNPTKNEDNERLTDRISELENEIKERDLRFIEIEL